MSGSGVWRKRTWVLARFARLTRPAWAVAVAAAVVAVAAGAGARAFLGQEWGPGAASPVAVMAADGAYRADRAVAAESRSAFGRPPAPRPRSSSPSLPLRAAPAPAAPGEGSDGLQLGQVRPFRHLEHERISCRACHGAGEQHRTNLVRSPRDCAACHHDDRRGNGCADCHPSAELPAPGSVAATVRLTVWADPRVRALPFAHETHAGITCRDCHQTPVTLATGAGCTACHRDHHRPEADCAACHAPTERSVHPSESHLSCAGSGCHAPGSAPVPAASGNLCLMCHTEQQGHERGSGCTDCHHIPDLATAQPAFPRAAAQRPRAEP